jgi:glycosyltransferase involved in cell wall biosynthesis
MTPKISIIVPCYNQAQYLDECLQSVLEQTYQNWECIIVNDGSTDETEKIAQKFESIDVRFRYFFQENKGVSSARNLAIFEAVSPLILPLDGDDFLSLEYVEKAINCFEQNPNLTLVYPNVNRFGEKNGLWNLKPFSLQNLAIDNMIVVSSVFKKQDWERVGGFDQKMLYGIEDWEFWIAILKNDGLVKKMDHVGLHYRIAQKSRQTDLNQQKLNVMQDYIYKKHIDFFLSNSPNPIALNQKLKTLEYDFSEKLRNKKFVIDLFCKTFFGFTLFKNVS